LELFDPKGCITVKQLAAKRGVSYETVYRAIRAGRLEVVDLLGRYIIPKKVAEEFMRTYDLRKLKHRPRAT
jgi:excisionase family DNA binding protein